MALGDNPSMLEVTRDVIDQVEPGRLAGRLDTVLGLADAVEASLGIGDLPCFVGDTRPGLTRLAPPEPAYATDLWLLTHLDLRGAPRIRALLDFLAVETASNRAIVEGVRSGGIRP